MGSILALSITVLTILSVVFGLLLGLLRGWRRAALRLGLIILSIILAFAFRNLVTNTILDYEFTLNTSSGVETFTVASYLSAVMGSYMEGVDVASLVLPLIKTLLNVIVFLMLFGVLEFVTWIVFAICKIFVKPKEVKVVNETENGQEVKTVKKPYRLIGAGIGALQGFIVVVCVCVLLTGVIAQSNKIIVAANDLMPSGEESADVVSGEESDDISETLGFDPTEIFDNYLQSGIGKFYNTKPAQGIVTLVSKTKIDGETKTLTGQVDAFATMLKFAGKLGSMDDDLGNIFDAENENAAENIRDFFYELDDLIHGDGVTDETRKTINKAIGSLAESFGDQFDLPIDLTDMDFTDIDFKNEGDLIADLVDYSKSENVTKDEVEDILDKVSKSELVLPILDNSNINLGEKLSDSQLEQVEEILDSMEGVNEDKMEAMRRIFGLN